MDEQVFETNAEATCENGELICLYNTDLPRIVIIGGGFAGLSLVKYLSKEKVQVVLIDKNNFNQFQPLLYQVATSGLEPDSIVFPFRKQIANSKNVVFRMANYLNSDGYWKWSKLTSNSGY